MNFRRALSLMLVFILLFTCQCVSAFATEQTAEEAVLLGTFNNSEGLIMELVEDNIFSTTLELEAGNYQFKIKYGETEYGHPGTVKDSTAGVSADGFVFSEDVNAKCTLVATGGKYSFVFNTETHKLQVIKDDEFITDSDSDTLTINVNGGSVVAEAGDIVTYSVYLSADKLFEDVQAVLSYNSDKLSLSDVSQCCPNLNEFICNTDCAGVVAVNASDYSGCDFIEEKLLLTLDFTVIKGGETSLEFTVQEMTATDGTSYFTYSSKASEGADLRETVNVTPDVPEVAEVEGYSITLGGNIAVNFHMTLSEETVADENAKVVFTLPNGSKKSVSVNNVTPNEDGVYVFTCEVAAKEMASAIKAQVVTSTDNSEVFEYSVKEYAETILSDPETYAKEQELVKAMLNYGAYAQLHFGYNTRNLANESLSDDEKTLTTADLSEYKYTLTGSEAGVAYYGSLLSLESETAIKHYFRIEDEENIPTITVNGVEVTARKKNGYYEVKISDILAQNLDAPVEVKVGGLTLDYNALSYGYLALNGSNTKLKNVINALYAYNMAADVYNA